MTSLLRALHRSRQKQKEIPFEGNFQTGFTILAVVIPSGFEPEAYCLEGSCSIQLSYGTNLLIFMKSAAKVGNFSELHKFQTENLMYDLSSKELFPITKDFVALKRPIFSGSLARCSSRSASVSASVGASCG